MNFREDDTLVMSCKLFLSYTRDKTKGGGGGGATGTGTGTRRNRKGERKRRGRRGPRRGLLERWKLKIQNGRYFRPTGPKQKVARRSLWHASLYARLWFALFRCRTQRGYRQMRLHGDGRERERLHVYVHLCVYLYAYSESYRTMVNVETELALISRNIDTIIHRKEFGPGLYSESYFAILHGLSFIMRDNIIKSKKMILKIKW